MIQLEQVSLTMGENVILQDVSLQLAKGQSLGIIGPNGAGKSTLLQVLGGHLTPTAGKAFLDQKPIDSYRKKDLAKRVAFMQQIANVSGQFTAYETVMLGRYPFLSRFQMESERDHEICEKSMERTCTLHLRDRNLEEVSGGERQRILLAQVLAQEPELLLLDEPTTYLDMFHQLELLTLLNQAQKDGLTWVAVLHDLNLAAQYCDQLLLLSDGKVVQIGRPQEIFSSHLLEEVFGVRVTVVDVPGLPVPQIVISPKWIAYQNS
ncbi:ABC transporter ATP-binding protein [Effusibacillus consociatus]|uniref:ABC transporter ATP-binding protein n=1 Tax=Effusibacillus consociatus TaxID=1117041 RepID=A0ABV9Q2I0_9BACL